MDRSHLTRPPDPRKVLPGSITVRGGMGLGDALYVQAVARHWIKHGEKVTVCNAWPQVFKPLTDTGNCVVLPFTRLGVARVAHYSMRKHRDGTDQFQDVCITAAAKGLVELRLDWSVMNRPLVDGIRQRAGSRPVVLVQMARAPMGRKDGFGKEILPRREALQRAVDNARDAGAYLVQIGAGAAVYPLTGLHEDLSNKTSVYDLLDLGQACDEVLGYCSYLIPLAESFDKPGLLVWSQAGLKAKSDYVRRITPQKVIHKKHLLSWVLDSETFPQRTIKSPYAALHS